MNYDIAALKRKMLVKYPFFGSVIANVDYKETKDIETAATDGKIIYYNDEFLKKISTDEQTFVLAHEVCHIAFNHILRSEGKNPMIWNIATDGVINQFLKRDGLTLSEGVIDIPDAINYDAEELYEKLLQEMEQNKEQCDCNSDDNNKEQQAGTEEQNGSSGQASNSNEQQSQQQQNNCSGQGNSGQQQSDSQQQSGGNGENSEEKQQSQKNNGMGAGNSQEQDKESKEKNTGGTGENGKEEEKKEQDVGHDTHSMWAETVKKYKEEQEEANKKDDSQTENKQNKNKSTANKKSDVEKDNQDSQKNKKKGNNQLEKKQEELENMGEKDAFSKNREEKKKQLEKLKDEIAKQASLAGTTTNSDTRDISNIGITKPIMDWRYVLRETIKYDVDWSYKNSTIENGVVTANLEEIPKPETEIVIDTSGSVSKELLMNFLGECKNILKHTKLKVGCFDTEFYGFHEIRTEKDIENMEFIGNGGTNFNVAVNAFSMRVENKIIFTDGEAPMPSKRMDAIWLVYGDEEINPSGGKVIYINDEQLKKLRSGKIRTKSKYKY